MDDQQVNPNETIQEAKTVEEAIEKGAAQLGLPLHQVDHEVLEEGSQGIFGIGAKPARVKVRGRSAGADEVSAKVTEMVTEIMKRMGISASVTTHLDEDIHRVEIETAGSDGLLIGKKGESLDDFGHLLRRMVGKQLKRSVRMDVDVGGYKKRRGGVLTSKALSLAARVKSTGKEMQMEPLSAAERRVVHLALADDPQVKTHTIGDGDLKNVVISAVRKGSRNSGGGRRGGEGGGRPDDRTQGGHRGEGRMEGVGGEGVEGGEGGDLGASETGEIPEGDGAGEY
jgi:spoIIIJ-associated protein